MLAFYLGINKMILDGITAPNDIKKLDASEYDNLSDAAYLRACRENARSVVRQCGWTHILCADGDLPRTPEDIHAEVYGLVRNLL